MEGLAHASKKALKDIKGLSEQKVEKLKAAGTSLRPWSWPRSVFVSAVCARRERERVRPTGHMPWRARVLLFVRTHAPAGVSGSPATSGTFKSSRQSVKASKLGTPNLCGAPLPDLPRALTSHKPCLCSVQGGTLGVHDGVDGGYVPPGRHHDNNGLGEAGRDVGG